MEHSRFKFNREDLKYDRLDNSLSARIWRVVIYVAAILVLAVMLNVFYSLFFDTPRERHIRRENEMLQEQYEALSSRKQMVDTVMKEVQETDRNIYRVIFETEPVELSLQSARSLRFQELLQMADEEIVYRSALHLDSMMILDQRSTSSYDLLWIKGERKKDALTSIPGIQPIHNPDLHLVASGFGYRMHPIYKIRKMHEGIDFSAPVGTPVLATADGVVESAIRSGRGLGNRILIDHGKGYKTLYACMEDLEVRPGQQVKRGERIGTVGDSGLSVAPHLHYEVHLNGQPMNPINYFFLELDPLQYDRLIKLSMLTGQSFD